MAVSDCIRQCRRCGVQFRRTAKNQPTMYCSEACRGKPHAPKRTEPYALTCDVCKKEFSSNRKKLYCCQRCCWLAQNRKKGKASRQDYNLAVRNPVNWFTCEHCGKDSHRYLSKRNSGPNRFCSMACRSNATRARLESERKGREVPQVVLAEVAALRRIARWVPGMRRTVRPCRCCGAKVLGIGERSRQCDSCTAIARREGRRLWRRTPSGKAKRRAEKSSRRAVERGVEADLIDPIRVFERDGWRCHLCGCKTPRSLRGTYKDAAPELDHMVPLAANGTHTWGNVACACRRCNMKKGAKPLGQLLIGFAA